MDSGNASASAPESSQRGGSQSLSDSPDSTKIGTTNDSADSSRTTAEMPVESSSVYYNMSHKRRGLAIVISYSKFHASLKACRGKEGDVGVLLTKTKTTSVTDHVTIQSKKEYLIPLCTDMLIMWATYPGTYSFRSRRNSGREASVFIYFLTKILDKDGGEEDLASMLLSVTRLVGIQYESYSPDEDKNNKKQMPYTMSTLMKKIKFF